MIDRCDHIIGNAGNVRPLDDDTRTGVMKLKDRWSAEGKRVILLARKVIPGKDVVLHPSSREFESEMINRSKTGLILVGLVGIVDPPRDEIPEVVKTLRRAGIRIFMVGLRNSISFLANGSHLGNWRLWPDSLGNRSAMRYRHC